MSHYDEGIPEGLFSNFESHCILVPSSALAFCTMKGGCSALLMMHWDASSLSLIALMYAPEATNLHFDTVEFYGWEEHSLLLFEGYCGHQRNIVVVLVILDEFLDDVEILR